MRTFNYQHQYIKRIAFTFGWLLFFISASAQQPDTAKVPIHILNTVYYEHITTDTGEINKLVGDVQLEQNGTLMYCDSAYLNLATNYLEAFDNVHIVQPSGTDVTSDYLRYTGNNHTAFLRGNCNLTDGKNSLQCEELYYNLSTKIAEYFNGGTLHNAGTIVTSNYGLYNINSKDSRFTEQVVITDTAYHITSTDIGYNTATKLVQFYGPSVVISDKSTLHTKSGTWDGLKEIAHFVKRSSLISGAQYIEADTMDYSKPTGFGNAKGKVIAIDTGQKTTLYCGYAQFNEVTEHLYAYIKPVMKKMTGDDSLFIRADTFFSAPVVPKIDSAKLRRADSLKVATGKKGKKTVGKQGSGTTITMGQPVDNDSTTAPIDTMAILPTDTLSNKVTDSSKYFVAAKDTVTLIKKPDSAAVSDRTARHGLFRRRKNKVEHPSTGETPVIAQDTALKLVKTQDTIKTVSKPAVVDTMLVTNTATDSTILSGKMLRDTVANDLKKRASQPGKKTLNDKTLSKSKIKQDDSTSFLGREDFTLNPDSTSHPKDTSDKRYFIAYHHVLIFSDSLQGKCDSLSYSQKDSIMRLMITPIVWSRKSQITGDTVLLYMDSSKLRKIYVPYDAFVISQSGPAKAKLFDQIQGRTLTGNFTANTITDMIVEPEAQTIYYSKDDAGAYLGPVEVTGLRMRVLFRDQTIYRVLYESDVKQKITPMLKADFEALKLSRFQWHEDELPKTREELFK